MLSRTKKIGKTAIILLPPWSPLVAPLGITSVAEIFRKNGIECKEFDWNIELLHDLEKKFGLAFTREHILFWDSVYVSPFWKNTEFRNDDPGMFITEWLIQKFGKLISDDYSVFGFSSFESNYPFTQTAIAILRNLLPDAVILLGGPATNNIIEYKYNHNWLADIDIIFYKEVEETLPLFIKQFGEQKGKKNTPGTATVRKRALFSVPYWKRIVKRMLGLKVSGKYFLDYSPFAKKTDLKTIPDINFDYLNLQLYKSGGIPIEFSRGCTGACAFCSETVRYKPYRNRPVEDLIRNFKIAKEKYNAKYINLTCSALNGDKEHLAEFCKALIAEKIELRWGGNARPDHTLSSELLLLMAASGCADLDFGLESGSDHVLSLMNKKCNADFASEIIDHCFRLKIKVAVNLIIGFPGETENDLQQTIDFIEKHHEKVAIFNVSKCYLDGNAPLGKHPGKFGVLTLNDRVVAVDPNHSDPSCLPEIINKGPHWSDWCTVSGDNTPFIREKRYQQVLRVLDNLEKRGNTPHDAKHSGNLESTDSKEILFNE